jgi:putative sigma-54 modulation protein
MNIQIIGEHLLVTDSITQYINHKFYQLSIPEKLQQVEFRLGIIKGQHYVHFTAHSSHEDVVIKTQENDLYASIDKIIDKIHRSFIKIKEKHNVHLHKINMAA